MKKLFLLSLSCLVTMSAWSQKQAGGEKNLEVQFAPFSENPVSVSGIRFRKFNAAGNSAWRINLMIEAFSVNTIKQQAILATVPMTPELTHDSSSLTVAIAPGYEKHFPGTGNLSPYWGAELAFIMATTNEEEMFEDPNAAGATYTVTTKNENGGTGFGINLLAGCDFYFAKSIYLGIEFGYGFVTASASDIDYSTTEPNADAIPSIKQGSGFLVGSNSNAQIRLGFLF